jgi:glucose-6-phosphate isomerase
VDPTTSSSWKRLVARTDVASLPTIAELFQADAHRAEAMSVDITLPNGAMVVDFSKQHVTPDVLEALLTYADEAGVADARDAMFAGGIVNLTEAQPALHTALRARATERVMIDGSDVVAEVHAERERLAAFARDVRSGITHAADGRPFTHVLNIGIGGSDLGPALAYAAWSASRKPDLECRFVSNVDPVSLEATLDALDPARTLVVMCSKSFSTAETVANCRDVQAWLAAALGSESVATHSVVVTAQPSRVAATALVARCTFASWKWVGGRYSISSSMNLANAIAFGPEVIDEFLDGMNAMDAHFRSAEPRRNAPLLLALINLWNRALLGRPTRAMLVYQDALAGFVDYIQQLEMESNGKSVRRDGGSVTVDTAPIVWGGVGTNAQHAFMQLVHQGTTVVPVDFIGVAHTSARNAARHDELIANMFAQAEALAFGRDEAAVRRSGVDAAAAPHRVAPGNRPSTTILVSSLSPSTLGASIALYEHAVFAYGVLLDINSFDQWGVELGKHLANSVIEDLGRTDVVASHDASTTRLLQWYRQHR